MSASQFRGHAISQLEAGNIPDFLRDLAPVRVAQSDNFSCMGSSDPITLCRMRQPISIGSNGSYQHTPLSITDSARVLRNWGFTIGTPTMVDAAIAQADRSIIGAPQGTDRMTSPWRYGRYSTVLRGQMPDQQTTYAGATKQYVLTNSLSRCEGGFTAPTLYGWLREGGNYWQRGSIQHVGGCGNYVDYSQIPQPFSNFAAVGGRWYSLTELMADPDCARSLNAGSGGGRPINSNILEAFYNPNISAPRSTPRQGEVPAAADPLIGM